MCGIAGILRFDGQTAPEPRLHAMRDHLTQRGPDGHGTSIHGPCGLAHARLAILDRFGGRQPMHAPAIGNDGPLHVVFNGEIYNHHALRRKLRYLGHTFVTDHSDTETLLLGYRQWGTELPQHLEGMFAFGLWDEQAQQLFLARDRAGQKPLHLRRTEYELSFASLIGTLVAGAEPADRLTVDRAALLTFLRFGYAFGDAMIEDVEELPPAHWMTVDAHGRTDVQPYWHVPTACIRESVSAAKQDLGAALENAVAMRLEADVPLGCFLSGGIDSSIVAALAQRALRKRGGESLRTFSVAMPDAGYDETAHAQAVAAHIGSDHHVLQTRPGRAIDDLEHLMALTGAPTADSSLLPTYWLCRAAREQATVALSGDGGDELFGGYDRYRAMRILRRHAWWLRYVPTGFLQDANPRSTATRARRLIHAARAGDAPAQQYQSLIHLFTDAQIRELEIPGVSGWAHTNTPSVPDWPGYGDPVLDAMRWDRAHYLPHVLLRKVDRASMAVPLEVRAPILDTRVQELAAQWLPSVLMPGGRLKGLLRALARDLVPAGIVDRPKRGFAVPIGEWFRDALRDDLADRLFDGTLDTLGVRRQPVQRMFDEHIKRDADHTHRLFALLQLALWGQWLRAQRTAQLAA